MFKTIPRRFRVTNSDRINYILGRTYSRQIGVVLTLNGLVDEERMARAVRLLMDAEPVLGCRLVDPEHPYWERRDDLDSVSLCQTMAGSHTDEALREVIKEPLDPFCDPLVSVRILRGEVDTVVLKLEHTVSDGGGAKDVLNRLMDIYNRLGEDSGYRPAPNVRGDRSFNQLFWSLGIRAKRQLLKPFPQAPRAAVFPYREPHRNDWAIARQLIQPELFRRLKAYAGVHGATLNDLLLTAFLRTFFQVGRYDPESPLAVNVPVDLRAFTKRKRAGSVANLTGGYFPAVVPAECTDFPQTLKAVQKTMADWKNRRIQIGRGVISDLTGRGPGFGFFERLMDKGYTYSEQTGKIVPVMTNLGLISGDILKFADLEVTEAYFLGPVIFPPHFTVCISTYRETMTLSTGYCREPEGEQPVEVFLERMKAELEQAVT